MTNARLRVITAIDQLHGYAFVVLAFEIAHRIGLSLTVLAAVAVLHGAGFSMVGRIVAARSRRRPATVARVGATVRAVALALGAIPAVGPVASGLALHGASRSTVPSAHPLLLADDDRERHRLAGRLGNVGAPLLIGALALFLGWPAVFAVLALLAVAPVLPSISRTTGARNGRQDDEVVARFVRVPGGRLVLTVIAMAALTEFPVHVLAFGHLGAIGIPIGVRAGVAAAGELIGVLANLAMGDRLAHGAPRSPKVLALATFVSVTAGLALLIVSVSARSPAIAIAALALGAIGISTVIPFLALATRAVLDGVVHPAPVVVAGIAVAFAVRRAPDVGMAIVMLSALPVLATVATVAMSLRSPSEVAAVLDGVANVTPERRITTAPLALEQA